MTEFAEARPKHTCKYFCLCEDFCNLTKLKLIQIQTLIQNMNLNLTQTCSKTMNLQKALYVCAALTLQLC